MDQLPNNLEPKRSWATAHHALAYIFLFVAAAAIVAVVYYWQVKTETDQSVVLPSHTTK